MHKGTLLSIAAILLLSTNACTGEPAVAEFGRVANCASGPNDYANIEVVLTRGSQDKDKMKDSAWIYRNIILGLRIKELVVEKCDNGNPSSGVWPKTPVLVTIYPSKVSIPGFGAYARVLYDPKKGAGWNEIDNYVKDGSI